MPFSFDAAFAELWKQLIALDENDRACSEYIATKKASCRQNCGKAHIFDCEDCYDDILDRIRVRFTHSGDKEWFTINPNFIHQVDDMFKEAVEKGTDPSTIDSRIDLAKRNWYVRGVGLSKIGRAYEQQKGEPIETPLDEGAGDLTALEADIALVLEEAAAGMRMDFDEFMTRYRAAKDDKEIRRLYVDAFFREPNGQVDSNSIMYEETLNKGTAVDRVMEAILVDLRDNLAREKQRERVQRRLDEFRRAEIAFQDKIRKARARPPPPPKVLPPEDPTPRVPPCSVCNKDLGDGAGSYPCSVCLAFTLAELQDKLHVYCSEACRNRGHNDHVAQAHKCDAARCVRTRSDDKPEPNARSCICRECLIDLGKPTMYCSVRCATLDFQAHREHVHIPARRRLQKNPDVDVGMMRYDAGLDRNYHASDISKCIWTAQEAKEAIIKGLTQESLPWNVSSQSNR